MLSVSQVLQQPPGLTLPGFCGKIIYVSDQKPSGDKGGHAQRIQVADTEDGDAKLQVWLFDAEKISSQSKGKAITIMSGLDGKKKINGVETKEDDYNVQEGEPTKIKIFVKGKFAKVSIEGQTRKSPAPATKAPEPDTSAQDQAADDAAQHQPSDDPAPPTAKRATPPERTLADAQADVKRFRANLMQMVNGYELCLNAADWLAEQRGPAKALTPEHKQAMVASLFIAMDRGHFMHLLPGNMTVEQLMERKG